VLLLNLFAYSALILTCQAESPHFFDPADVLKKTLNPDQISTLRSITETTSQHWREDQKKTVEPQFFLVISDEIDSDQKVKKYFQTLALKRQLKNSDIVVPMLLVIAPNKNFSKLYYEHNFFNSSFNPALKKRFAEDFLLSLRADHTFKELDILLHSVISEIAQPIETPFIHYHPLSVTIQADTFLPVRKMHDINNTGKHFYAETGKSVSIKVVKNSDDPNRIADQILRDLQFGFATENIGLVFSMVDKKFGVSAIPELSNGERQNLIKIFENFSLPYLSSGETTKAIQAFLLELGRQNGMKVENSFIPDSTFVATKALMMKWFGNFIFFLIPVVFFVVRLMEWKHASE